MRMQQALRCAGRDFCSVLRDSEGNDQKGWREGVKEIRGRRKGCSERMEMWGGWGDSAAAGNCGKCQETPRNEFPQPSAHPNLMNQPWLMGLAAPGHPCHPPVCPRPEGKETRLENPMAAVTGQRRERRKRREQRKRISVLIHGGCAPGPSL